MEFNNAMRITRCFNRTLTYSVLMLSLVLPAIAQAGIGLDQSRIIFRSSQKNQNVTIQNSGEKTYLIQARVQDGAIEGPTSEHFLVVPPLFRLEANSQHVMLLMPKETQSLAKDRESLFYFSATAIPAGKKPAEQPENVAKLSIATRVMIKLFYRPDGLPESYEQAAGRLQFTSLAQGVCFINPTPYYITLDRLWADGVAVADSAGLMIAPKSAISVKQAGKGKQMSWQAINDYGGLTEKHQTTITAAGAKSCQFVD
ncbi:Chaperone protein focC precursor [Budvicia aquatica]|uniref:Chaperone protein focC n=2 Tax=Budvicia aquatica TaxID=82979 RepID=A0A2C6DAB8_9GAMM|nr:molecular chaperone [Budvicia aquatica]VFS45935.1 Chaperone protein focC precursor [Budvicia aquatica]